MTPRAIVLTLVCAIVPFVPAANAQDRQVVFVHGLNSNGGTWESAAERLKQYLAIAPERPSLSGSSYEDQANSLNAQLWWLRGDAIAVGHSNGGIVSRHWSALHGVGAIVTLSTPHRGAPVFAHVADWVNFNMMAFDFIGGISASFGASYDDSWWVYAAIQGVISLSTQGAQDAILQMASTVGFQHWLPIFPQMVPGSSYLSALNASGNLGREAGAVATRVGIVNVAQNFYRGGVFRAIWPEYGDAIADSLHASAALLDYYALQLYGSPHPRDWQRAGKISNLAWWLWVHEDIWCRTVSDPSPGAYSSAGYCNENDTLVPTWSQVYPGALNIERRNTPAHTKQTEGMDGTLYEVLTSFVHVPARGATPPPQNPPPGSPPSGASDTLNPGEYIGHGQELSSGDGRFGLSYQGDGNLVLYRNDGRPLWASQTAGTSAGQALMQTDGNFVVYDANGTPVWASGTHMYPGARLTVQPDGNVVIYTADGTPVWATGTAGW